MAAISSIAKKWSASALFTRASAGPLEHHGDLPVENQPSQRSGSGAVEVAAGLVFREGKLLITQRYADAHLGGLWEFPGGKRKPTESFPECLTRELLEELGIEIEVGELMDEIRHSYPEKTVLLRFYRCRWLRHEPQALGCPDFRWIAREQLNQFAFPEADAALVKRLNSTPELWR